MWTLIFIISLSIAGSQANVFQECDKSICGTEPPPQIEAQLPNVQELQAICKPVMDRINCLVGVIEDCTGQNIQELASSDNVTVAKFTTLGLNLRQLVIDICDEDSMLHAGYVSSVDCVNGVFGDPNPKCHKEAEAIYDAFKTSSKLIGGNEVAKDEDADCLVTGYRTACLSLEVKDKCGETARSTVVEIMRRIQFMSFISDICSPEQQTILKTEFLDFLDFEEPKKNWFSEVFNTRK